MIVIPKIKYDVSNVEDGGDFKQAKPGMYIAKIATCEHKESKSTPGSMMLEITLEIVRDSKGKKVKEKLSRIWHYVPTDPEASWAFRLKEFIKALGLKPKGALDPDKIVGTEVQVQVKADKDLNDEYRAKVGRLLPLPEDEEEEDEEEDEDEEDTDADEEEDDSDEEDEDEDSDDEEDDDEESSDYDEMSLTELRKEARSRGIKVGKAMDADDLIEALTESDAEEDDEDEDDEEEEDYNEWSADDLKAELKERGLKATGSKKVMVARLEKDDESDEDPF